MSYVQSLKIEVVAAKQYWRSRLKLKDRDANLRHYVVPESSVHDWTHRPDRCGGSSSKLTAEAPNHILNPTVKSLKWLWISENPGADEGICV
jgi:hypothetical protein